MSKPLALIYYVNLLPGSQVANRLQDLGYRVQALTALDTLVETSERETPLVVVAEILPDAAACAAIARLKKNPATTHIPVLGYSDSHTPAQQTRAIQSGVSLLAGRAAISEQLPQLLDQVLQVE
jgi:PleD family two-component response regulator